MLVDSPMKMFSLFLDIFFFSDLYIKPAKSILTIVSPFSAQIYLETQIINPNLFCKYFLWNHWPTLWYEHMFALLIFKKNILPY